MEYFKAHQRKIKKENKEASNSVSHWLMNFASWVKGCTNTEKTGFVKTGGRDL